MAARALLDSGTTRTAVSAEFLGQNCINWHRSPGKVKVANETTIQSAGEVTLGITTGGQCGSLRCVVIDPLFCDIDVLLGMDCIRQWGGVLIDGEGRAQFGHQCKVAGVCAAVAAEPESDNLTLNEEDFSAVYQQGAWVVKWKWKSEPVGLGGYVPNYKVKEGIREEFEEKVGQWIRNGWLKPYTGPVKAVIPLMAVEQPCKKKVRPVLDFRKLNEHVRSYTGDSDVCEDKIRSWRSCGENAKMLDLQDAYLQLRVDPSLWAYQVVHFKGRVYCLTRLGFGLNCAPRIMTHVLRKVLGLDPQVAEATDSYVDDILVREDVVSAAQVSEHLEKFGLLAKPPQPIADSRVLGLQLYRGSAGLLWRRGNEVPGGGEEELSRSEFFSVCGRLVGHYPVCGWLRTHCSFAKRLCKGAAWNDKVGCEAMNLLRKILHEVSSSDPVGGKWLVQQRRECTVWCDASSLAIGVVLEESGECIEDGSWLRKVDDGAHINLAELEAAIRGLNLALKWKFEEIRLCTDSATVHGWLTSALTDSHRPKIYGLSEMLVRRRLMLVKEMKKEYNVQIHLNLVRSSENKADGLTRVSKGWQGVKRMNAGEDVSCFGLFSSIREVHEKHHFGAEKTLYSCEKAGVEASEAEVREVIRSCSRCATIDPAPVRWERGRLDVEECWVRLACDVTHYKHEKFLSVVDCGPSRFSVWRRLSSEDGAVVAREFLSLFRERGPPRELLLDNSTTFRSADVRRVCDKFGVTLRFRCAYRPGGNGIVERNHRTIKRTAARANIDPLDAVFWYNLLPLEKENPDSVPSSVLSYQWRFPVPVAGVEENVVNGPFSVGERVYVKPPGARCVSEWREGKVTRVHSSTNVEVDGVPRHVGDLRKRVGVSEPLRAPLYEFARNEEDSGSEEESSQSEDTEATPAREEAMTRRPRRAVRRPVWMTDYEIM